MRSEALRRATIGAHLGQPLRESLARVSSKDWLPKLDRFALSLGASSFDARDAVPSASAQRLEGKTACNSVEDTGIARDVMAMVHRLFCHHEGNARKTQ